MAALVKERDTLARGGDLLDLPAAANVVCFAGALAARDANGNATPGATATTLRGLGRVRDTVDNTGGAAGAERVKIEKGVFRFENSAGGDEISTADIGNDCFIVDDQTVAATNGTNTRSVAGTVYDVDDRGVWVDLR